MWQKPSVTGNKPSPRAFHTMNAIGTRIYVYGGHSQNFLNDMYVLDIFTFHWKKVEISEIVGVNVPGRCKHSCVEVGQQLVIIGGLGERTVLSDMYSVNTGKKVRMQWVMCRKNILDGHTSK